MTFVLTHRRENSMTGILLVFLTTLSAPPLNGGFIQYDNDVIKEITAKDWIQVLDQMNAMGMKVVIVQFLGIAKDTGETPPLLRVDEWLGKPAGGRPNATSSWTIR